jgi:hypothetical protein
VQPSYAPAPGWSGPRQVQDQPAGQPPGQGAQVLVGGPGHGGQQLEGGVGVLDGQLLEGRLVQLTQLGRDLVETWLGGELVPGEGPSLILGQLLFGLVAFGDQLLVVGAPRGARAFPGSSG